LKESKYNNGFYEVNNKKFRLIELVHTVTVKVTYMT